MNWFRDAIRFLDAPLFSSSGAARERTLAERLSETSQLIYEYASGVLPIRSEWKISRKYRGKPVLRRIVPHMSSAVFLISAAFQQSKPYSPINISRLFLSSHFAALPCLTKEWYNIIDIEHRHQSTVSSIINNGPRVIIFSNSHSLFLSSVSVKK